MTPTLHHHLDYRLCFGFLSSPHSSLHSCASLRLSSSPHSFPRPSSQLFHLDALPIFSYLHSCWTGSGLVGGVVEMVALVW
jgi:hypothetical protein